MAFRSVFILFLFISAGVLNAEPSFQKLSNKAEISLLTFSPGKELYKAFGHSAIRVKDPVYNIDYVYNYGTFDFNAPNFYGKFALGQLKYWLSVSPFEDFKLEYVYANQSIYEHVFNFTWQEKQRLFDFLQNNYLPENRFYFYDFFFDNCATRIRDAVFLLFENELEFEDLTWYEEKSYRQIINVYLKDLAWSHFGIDIALGWPTDAIMAPEDYMFLPDYLMAGFDDMVIISENNRRPLIKNKIIIYESQEERQIKNYLPLAILTALLLLIIVLSYLEVRKGIYYKVIDTSFFIFSGLVGWLLLFLWLATDHNATGYNADLLWAFPLHLFFPLIFKRSGSGIIKLYIIFSLLLITSYFIILFLGFVDANSLIILLVLMAVTRIVRLLIKN